VRFSNEPADFLEEGKPVIGQAETATLDFQDRAAPIINHIVNQFFALILEIIIQLIIQL
jgi:hypothetical protein